MSSNELDGSEQQPLDSFGWTSTRATYMYYVHHAPPEDLLDYLKLSPIPDVPPRDLTDPA